MVEDMAASQALVSNPLLMVRCRLDGKGFRMVLSDALLYLSLPLFSSALTFVVVATWSCKLNSSLSRIT
jgi:hypothetical protein